MIKSLDARGLPPPPYIQFIPTLPTITFCIIYLTFIFLTFDFFHIVHNHSHLTLVEFWTYCIASVCHWTASVGVGVGEEGIVDAGEEEVSWVDRCL